MAAPAASPAKKSRPLPPYEEGKDNPWEKPFAFLVNRGWKYEGNPHSPNSRWYGPKQWRQADNERGWEPLPAHEVKKKVPIYGTAVEDWPGGEDDRDIDPATGKIRLDIKTGKPKHYPPGKRTVTVIIREIDRVFITPAPSPVSREEAVQTQIDLDILKDNAG